MRYLLLVSLIFSGFLASLEVESLQDNSLLRLNIGGHKFETTYNTIKNFGGKYLNTLLSGKFNILKDENGYIFIDRPTKEGKFIDYFLRTRKLPENFDINIAINAEEFFSIDPMLKCIERNITIMSECKRLRGGIPYLYNETSCLECKKSFGEILDDSCYDMFSVIMHLKNVHNAKIECYSNYSGGFDILYRVPLNRI